MVELLFFCFAGVILASAAAVVLLSNPVYSVLSLVFAFFVSSTIFILLGAEVVAMLLVIVYVGAVAVLFLFVVMMLDVDLVVLKHGFVRYPFFGILCCIVFLGCLARVILGYEPGVGVSAVVMGNVENVALIGTQLYTKYMYVFHLSGILLLISAMGVLILTLRARSSCVLKQDIRKQVSRSSAVRLMSPEVRGGVVDAD